MNTTSTLSRISHYLLATAKSFWGATVSMAWGLATFFLLSALITYYNQDTTLISGLFSIINVLMTNWQIVWGVLFVFDFLVNYKELEK